MADKNDPCIIYSCILGHVEGKYLSQENRNENLTIISVSEISSG